MAVQLTVKVGLTIDVELDDSEAEAADASSARATAAATSAVAPTAKRMVIAGAYWGFNKHSRPISGYGEGRSAGGREVVERQRQVRAIYLGRIYVCPSGTEKARVSSWSGKALAGV
jgi:hypothetical protein